MEQRIATEQCVTSLAYQKIITFLVPEGGKILGVSVGKDPYSLLLDCVYIINSPQKYTEKQIVVLQQYQTFPITKKLNYIGSITRPAEQNQNERMIYVFEVTNEPI